MKKAFHSTLFLFLLLGVFWAGTRFDSGDTGTDETVQQGRRILYYVDPMNPAHISDKPGLAPCGMKMEPVYAEDDGAGGGSITGHLPPGTLRITPQKQQMVGVRVETVSMAAQTHLLRTLGRVAADENLTYPITAGDNGWVWDVHGATTGSLVQEDQLMAAVYYEKYLTRQEEYLRALEYEERRQDYAMKGQADPPGGRVSSFFKLSTTFGGLDSAGRVVYNLRDQLAVTRLDLYSLGVGENQLREISQNKRIASDIEIRSPVKGIVMGRNVSPRQRFDRGDELFRIADLSRVWILADVFERDARFIRPGLNARVTVPQQGLVYDATVTHVLPVFDPNARTHKVRLEADNPEYELRPDMFVDVEFQVSFPRAISVSSDAVIYSGLRKTVYVDLGNGHFEPRRVETGRRLGGLVEIVRGLMPGERIAVSGNFLIDSESRMKPAAMGSVAEGEKAENDVVCGMEVSPAKSEKEGLTSRFEGKTYYFCARQCKERFDREHTQGGEMPDAMTASAPSAASTQPDMEEKAMDPVCGMVVHVQKAEAAGLKSEYQGNTYYFCHESCKKLFEVDPRPYAKTPAGKKDQHQTQHHGQLPVHDPMMPICHDPAQSGSHNHGEHRHD